MYKCRLRLRNLASLSPVISLTVSQLNKLAPYVNLTKVNIRKYNNMANQTPTFYFKNKNPLLR